MAKVTPTKKLEVLCTSMVLWEENEEGEKVKRVYTTGDTILVTAKKREVYLEMETGGRPLFRDADEGDDDEEEEKKELGSGASAPNAAAKNAPVK